MPEHEPPKNLENERALLGAMLLDEDSAKYSCASVRPEHFASDSNRIIFCVILDLNQKGNKADLVTVTDALRAKGQVERVGGLAYVGGLTDGIPVGGLWHVDQYARILKRDALLRSMITVGHALIGSCIARDGDPETILGRAQGSLARLASEEILDGDDGVTFREAAIRLLHDLESRDERKMIFTGLADIDKLTGGFLPGELVLFTADTGVGKTLIAQQTRRRSCQDGRVSLYASCEMSATHLESRELATIASVPHYKMRRPEKLSPDDWKALLAAASHECDRCRIVDGEISPLRIRAQALRMKAKTGLDLVIVDYDELVLAAGQTELEQLRNVVVECKKLAINLPVCVILISQLRKILQGENRKRPTLQSLYGTYAKAKHANVVVYVDREYVRELKGDETKARLCVLKNRDGPVGAIDVRFNTQTLSFESLRTAENQV